MKKVFFLPFLLFAFIAVSAQNISVKSFQALPMDMTASSLEGKRTDQNGEVAALIKVMTTEKGFLFEGGTLGIVDVQQRVGELWVWVPRGLRKITVLHQQLGELRDYYFPEEIFSERTYEMVLTTAKIVTRVKEEVTQQYLTFRVVPANAILEVDDKIWELNAQGSATKYLNFGSYTYRVQAPNYHPDAGKVTVNDPENSSTVTVTLRPNFGWIEVTGTGDLQGASVYIDNELVGKAPCKSEALKSGQYSVRIAKKMFNTYNETIIVNDNETTTISPKLETNGLVVTLKVDADAEIWLNGERKGVRSWTGLVAKGNNLIECKQDNHEDSQTTLSFTTEMEGKTIHLTPPRPVFGSLTVESNPGACRVYIDGVDQGTTPKTINNVLVGRHVVRVAHDGFLAKTDTVTIKKDEPNRLSVSLRKGKETFSVAGVTFTMIAVEGGTFLMGGNDENATKEEKPVHSVTVGSFYICETEVTQALWNAVWDGSPNGGSDKPMGDVNWDKCHLFIFKLNRQTKAKFRMPTEAEWEYAARGGRNSKGYLYAGSDSIDDVGWYKGNSRMNAQPVKTKAPNELGLYDMTGNVEEWCLDGYTRYGARPDEEGTFNRKRVLRGGSKYKEAKKCRVSYREYAEIGHSTSGIGLRLVMSAE